MKIKFLNSTEKNIIFDYETGQNLLKFLNFKKKDFFIFELYPNTLYLSLGILVNFTKLLFNKSKYKNINKLNILNFFYLISVFKTIKPYSILTYLDNSLILSTIVYNFPNIKVVSIQNGVRSNFILENYKLYLDNYYSFGKSEKNLLLKNNSKLKNFRPIGSLSSKHYYLKNKNSKKVYDLCLVCQLPGAINQLDYTPRYNHKFREILKIKVKKSIDQMNLYLSNYCSERNLNIAICLRNQDDNIKFDYEKLFPKNSKIFQLSSKEINNGKTYEIMSKSKIIIGFNTTCVREAWGFNKAIYIDYTGTNLFNEIYNNDMLIIRNQSYDYLKKKIDYLLNLDGKIYEKKINKFSKNYMEKMSINEIRKYILDIIN